MSQQCKELQSRPLQRQQPARPGMPPVIFPTSDRSEFQGRSCWLCCPWVPCCGQHEAGQADGEGMCWERMQPGLVQLLAQGGTSTARVSSWRHNGSHGLVARHEGYLEAIATEAQDVFRDYNIPLDHF